MGFSLLDPRNGEAFDLPLVRAPSRTYVVASTPRTGSTLLCRLLWDIGRVGAPKEYLNPMQMRDWEVRLGESGLRRFVCGFLRGPAVGLLGKRRWRPDELQRYVERIRARRTSADGLFGLKLHRHHFEQFFVSSERSLEAVLSPQHWVFLRREDRIAQAVSWARAIQSGRWATHQKFSLPVAYRRSQIQRLVSLIAAQEDAWEGFFRAEKIEPLCLRYEDLVEDREGTLRTVLDFLGVSDAANLPVPESDLERQADAISEAWIERYRRET